MLGSLGYCKSLKKRVWDLGFLSRRFVCPARLQTERSVRVRGYLEGHGDLVNGLIMRIIWVTIWIIGVINPLTKSP